MELPCGGLDVQGGDAMRRKSLVSDHWEQCKAWQHDETAYVSYVFRECLEFSAPSLCDPPEAVWD